MVAIVLGGIAVVVADIVVVVVLMVVVIEVVAVVVVSVAVVYSFRCCRGRCCSSCSGWSSSGGIGITSTCALRHNGLFARAAVCAQTGVGGLFALVTCGMLCLHVTCAMLTCNPVRR